MDNRAFLLREDISNVGGAPRRRSKLSRALANVLPFRRFEGLNTFARVGNGVRALAQYCGCGYRYFTSLLRVLGCLRYI